jgi:hypothetical protein
MITPRGGYEGSTSISVKAMGLDWFLPYAVTLIFIHHAALFLIEASNLSLFWHAAIKAVCSTLFTGTLLLILQYFRK